MSDIDESESTTSSDDDGPPEISEDFEKSFFKTLSQLKNDDPSIYDGNTKFFDPLDVGSAKNKEKKKDGGAKKNLNVEQLSLMQDDDNEDVQLPYNVEQKKLKDSLSKFVNDSDDDDDLLVTSKKSQEQIEKEEADYIQWLKGQKQEIQDKNTERSLKNLREYWNSNLDDDEAYLRDYILNKRFLDKDESDVEDLSEDSEDFEQQEEFEKEYNFRYESSDLIRRFPRNVDTSLRRKNSKRSEKRKEIKERKKMEKSKKQEVINRQKNLKAKEIAERLEKLKELTGNEKLAFNDNDIIKDFNSEEFDKKMNLMFDDDYYEGQDEEKPGIDDLDFGNDYGELDEAGENDQGEDCGENYAEEAEAGPSRKERKKTRTKRKKERKKKSFQDIASIEKPIYDPKLHESYQRYMDEYYSLDCEDFIDDIPCRYKYREVEPNDYGLTVEEILMADDKELNAWSSVKNILKLRPAHVERNHAKQYKWKAKNESLKRKILPSLFAIEEESEVKSSKKNKKKNKDNAEHEGNDTVKQEGDDPSELNIDEIEKPKKKKSKKKNKNIEEVDDIEINTEEDIECNENSEKVKQLKNNESLLNEEVQDIDEIQQSTEVKKNKKKKHAEKADEMETENCGDSGKIEEYVEQKEKKRKRQDNEDFNETKKARDDFASKQHGKNKYNNKFSKYNKKNHDFHDTRLSAYGLNPKKFKVK